MSRLGFGIDGGGTRARLQIFNVETGLVLKRITGNSTNIYSIPKEEVFDNIREMFENAGYPLSFYVCGCIGSAGLSRKEEADIFHGFLNAFLPGCPVYLCNDGEILIPGKLAMPEGYCLIAGTGSLALGRRRDGKTVRAGGLGYMLGDEGSALWISWVAIRRTLRSIEGRDLETKMLPMLMSHFKIQSPADFIALMHNHFDKATVASSAPIVLGMAETDPLAADITEKAADELVSQVLSVRQQLPDAFPMIALSGGVLENCEKIRKAVITRLANKDPELRIETGGGDAVDGACLLAKELLKQQTKGDNHK